MNDVRMKVGVPSMHNCLKRGSKEGKPWLGNRPSAPPAL